MKKTFVLEWHDVLGVDWMNIYNLELCLFSKHHTEKDLLKVTEVKSDEVV